MSKLRIFTVLMIAVLALALAGCTGGDEAATETSGDASSAFAAGDMVAAEWGAGSLYLAEVMAVSDDGMLTVKYVDDDTEDELTEDEVIAIEEKEWAVGDRVLAVWSVAKFYSGTIESADGDEYIVAWDDGSDPSAVTADMIIEFDEAYATE